MATYYVDALHGSDSNNGSTWALAFKTLNKVCTITTPNNGTNSFFFAPGAYTLTSIPSDNALTYSSAAGTCTTNFIGIGNVIFKNGSYYLRSIPSYAANITKNIYFRNINFVGLMMHTSGGIYGPTYYTKIYLYFYNCGFKGQCLSSESAASTNYFYSYFYNCITDGKLFPITTIPANSQDYLIKSKTTNLAISGTSSSNCRTDGAVQDTEFVINEDASSYNSLVQNAVHADSYQKDSIGDTFESALSLTMNNNVFYNESAAWKCATQGWIADPATSGNGTLVITDNAGIQLSSGDNVAALSPVMKFSLGLNLVGLQLQAVEAPPQVLDSNPSDPVRTIQYRYADYPFTQTQTTQAPTWQEYTRNTSLSGITCKYLQIRVVFQMAAAV